MNNQTSTSFLKRNSFNGNNASSIVLTAGTVPIPRMHPSGFDVRIIPQDLSQRQTFERGHCQLYASDGNEIQNDDTTGRQLCCSTG